MNVHNAYLHSNSDSLYMPYSEDDIIELEYNINTIDRDDTNATALVMSYEDGVGFRPMIYSNGIRFYQYNPKDIVIGSDDCDVYIYRMKIYSASLTDSNILSNFIADARDAETMISRYNRNQIYDENNALTPDSVANACPHLRVLKIECPHFTIRKTMCGTHRLNVFIRTETLSLITGNSLTVIMLVRVQLLMNMAMLVETLTLFVALMVSIKQLARFHLIVLISLS